MDVSRYAKQLDPKYKRNNWWQDQCYYSLPFLLYTAVKSRLQLYSDMWDIHVYISVKSSVKLS